VQGASACLLSSLPARPRRNIPGGQWSAVSARARYKSARGAEMSFHSAQLVLVLLIVQWLGQASSAHAGAVRVNSSSSLAEAFGDPSVTTVVLHGNCRTCP
jgi:hypothetical protein